MKIREEITQDEINVMQHFVNGGEIEFSIRNDIDHWADCENPVWDWDMFNYRIKEEPKTDWLKTGWVKDKYHYKRMITAYHENNSQPYKIEGVWLSDEDMQDKFTPCESPIGNNH
jgi:hypothetical protein